METHLGTRMTDATGLTPDAVLLRRIAEGDSEAVTQLHQRHSISLYALAYAVLMDPGDADLVVEGAFAQVTERAGEYDPATMAPYAWLTQTARRYVQALLHLRRPRAPLASFEKFPHAGGIRS